jgi:uncharacterized protein YndB with AHSA1/START domain
MAKIEKSIELKAPVGRVWRALTDHREFSDWFRVAIDGPFVPGQISRGHMLYPGYEHVLWHAEILKIEPERLFSFSWGHPKSFDKASYTPDAAGLTRTVVEFRLDPAPTGTLLTVTESGFENLPADLRDVAFQRNEGGWAQQMKNIEAYVAMPS